MKMRWMFFLLMPAGLLLAQQEENDEISYECNLSLLHLDLNFEDNESDRKELSFLEIDENDPSLLPWAIEALSKEDISYYIENRAREIEEDVEDPFFHISGTDHHYEPTFEKVRERKTLFGK